MEGWRAIDATFREQTEEGKFGREHVPHGGPSAAAFWLADLGQALLILRESGWSRLTRVASVARAEGPQGRPWLAQPRYQERLRHDDAETPNRLLFAALAYGLSGVLADDVPLRQVGRRFVDLAMTRYRQSDGVFLEKGGPDSSYQAVAASKLQVWITTFPT